MQMYVLRQHCDLQIGCYVLHRVLIFCIWQANTEQCEGIVGHLASPH